MLPHFISPEHLISSFGMLGIFFILILEAGFLIGVFLPGDSLVFAAGVFAATGTFNVFLVYIVCFIGTFLGDQLGYSIGRKYGPKIFKSETSLFFNKNHLDKTHAFFEKYGPKAVVLARFIPFVRTGLPTFAGAGKMSYHVFLKYNTLGAFIWTTFFIGLGYVAGKVFKNHLHILEYITVSIIFISIIIAIREIYKIKKAQ